jgi:hypothetical protein
MARQIVKQPNGLYGCWSTIVDDFVRINMTREPYIEYRAKEVYESKKEELTRTFNKIEASPDATHFVELKDFDECMNYRGWNTPEEDLPVLDFDSMEMKEV